MFSNVVMVPGIFGSGPEHWQSLWEAELPSAWRMAPQSWDAPRRADWIGALDQAVARSPAPPLVVCHSLGCLLFAHWRRGSRRTIRAAFLVAVPDPDGPAFPPPARDFAPLPSHGFGDQKTLALASSDDPFDPCGRGRAWADAQGAATILLGPRGHMNESSDLGDWPEGKSLLAAFEAGLTR